MKNKLFVACTMALLIALPLLAFTPRAHAQSTTLSLQLDTIALGYPPTLGDTFTLTLHVENVTDLWSWKVKITWDPSVLALVGSPTEGPFLQTAGSTFFAVAPSPAGEVSEVSCTLLAATGASGSGDLAYLTFEAIDESIIDLIDVDLVDTVLLDSTVPHNDIPHNADGALVDYAVTLSIQPTPRVTSRASDTFTLTLHVENVTDLWSWKVKITWDPSVLALVGSPTEGPFLQTAGSTFFAVAPSPAGEVSEVSCTLLAATGASGSGDLAYLTFEAVNASEYGITDITVASTVILGSGASHTVMPRFVAGGQVTVTLPGDVDGNRLVNIFDIVKMAGVYGKKYPNPLYNPNCDLDGDGDIDIFDIVTAAGNYGKSLP